jgi:GH25 family lysozyme M1 (1,4-beta-N-acetylmuramidase)
MLVRALVIAVFALGVNACTVGDEDSKAGDGLGDELTSDGTADDGADGVLAARVCAAATTTRGVDVSKWQGTVNWAKVKATGVEFAFLRVSDGATTRDTSFAANWSATKANGIIRGAYQFFRPAQSVTAQADLMINAIGTYTPGDLPPVIDVEDAGGLSAASVAGKVRQWVDKVKATLGVTPIVYTGKYFWRDQVGGPSSFAPNALWIAQYTSLCPDIPAPWTKWTFWQHTDSGSVNGIAGHVDMNTFNGSLAELQAFVGGGGAMPPPKALPFAWVRNAGGSYDFTVAPGAGVAKVELRVGDFLIGTATVVGGTGTLHYVFNVAVADRVIDAKGLTSTGAVAALGNGIIDSLAGTSVAVHQTGEHEYEVGLERAPATYASVEVQADGITLTDLDTGLQRSTRGAVRYKFANTGAHAIKVIARNSAGTVVDTRTRTLESH